MQEAAINFSSSIRFLKDGFLTLHSHFPCNTPRHLGSALNTPPSQTDENSINTMTVWIPRRWSILGLKTISSYSFLWQDRRAFGAPDSSKDIPPFPFHLFPGRVVSQIKILLVILTLSSKHHLVFMKATLCSGRL